LCDGFEGIDDILQRAALLQQLFGFVAVVPQGAVFALRVERTQLLLAGNDVKDASLSGRCLFVARLVNPDW